MKAVPVIAAIDGDCLAGTERDGTAKKSIDFADAGMQF